MTDVERDDPSAPDSSTARPSVEAETTPEPMPEPESCLPPAHALLPSEAAPAACGSDVEPPPGFPAHPAERRLPALPQQMLAGREAGRPWSVLQLARDVRGQGLGPFAAQRWRGWLKTAVMAAVLFGVSYGLYALVSWNRYGQPSQDTHFVYLAHAFKQGRVEMPMRPPHGNDWASWLELPVKGGETLRGIWLDRKAGKFQTLDGKLYLLDGADLDNRRRAVSCDPSNVAWGASVATLCKTRKQKTHYFVSFPPGPALLMMPFVPDADADGVDLKDPQKLGLNDVQFTIFFAALNIVLMFFLLQRLTKLGIGTRSAKENLLLTTLFGFGTNVLWCSVLGQVWFTALIVGLTFTLLYIMASVDTRHPLLAGLFLAFAMATRTPLAFSVVFFAYFLFFPNGKLRRSDWGEFFAKGALFAAPILVVGLSLMWFNAVRFQSPFEFGHTYLAAGGLRRIQLYGLFNVHFLSKNLMAAFTLLPRFQSFPPYIILSKHGMSLFLTTPALLTLIAYRSGARPLDRKWLWALWGTVIAIAVPGFFYQNTGWAQYGFRFSLDYTPYLVLLLALNRRRIGVLFVALTIVGILVSLFGAITFGRMGMFYQEWLIDPDR